MDTTAQLVCYDWNPQPRESDPLNEEEQQKNYSLAEGDKVQFLTLPNCTLVYRKYLDHAVASNSLGKVTTQTTAEGILIPHVIGNVTYSRNPDDVNIQDGSKECCYAFNGATPLEVPIIQITKKGSKKPLYYFDYREGQRISNLYKITAEGSAYAYMTDLYNLKSKSITGLNRVRVNGAYAPLMERKVPLKMNQTVQGQAKLTPDKVAAALTRHSVTNIIGTAMQRIPTNHQGDIMLSDNV